METLALNESRYDVVVTRLDSSMKRDWLVAAAATLAVGGLVGAFALSGIASAAPLDDSAAPLMAIHSGPTRIPDAIDGVLEDEDEEEGDTADENDYDESEDDADDLPAAARSAAAQARQLALRVERQSRRLADRAERLAEAAQSLADEANDVDEHQIDVE